MLRVSCGLFRFESGFIRVEDLSPWMDSDFNSDQTSGRRPIGLYTNSISRAPLPALSARCTIDTVQQDNTSIGSVESTNLASQEQFLVINDDALVNARIDGKVGVRSIDIVDTTDSKTTRSNEITNNSSNQEEEAAASNDSLAFNFLSTQSEPVIRDSFSSNHDPLVPSDAEVDSSSSLSSLSSPFSARMGTKCTVVRGYMTVYTYDATPYENLDKRILDALKEDMSTPSVVRESFLNDVVLGVRFIGGGMNDADATGENDATTGGVKETASSGNEDGINSRPGYVSAIQGSPSYSQGSTGGFSSFTFPMMILVALGMLFLVLASLFVYTSRVRSGKERRSRRYDDDFRTDSPGQGTYYEDEQEVGLNAVDYDDDSESAYTDYDGKDTTYYTITSTRQEYGHAVEHDYFETAARNVVDESSHFSRSASNVSSRTASSRYEGDNTVASDASVGFGIQIQEVHQAVDEKEECYSIHSIRSTVPNVRVKTSAPDTYELQYGDDQSVAGSLASRDSLNNSPRRSPPRSPGRKFYPSPSRLFGARNRMSAMREEDEESIARDAYIDDRTVNMHDPHAAGLEVSLTPWGGGGPTGVVDF